MTVCRRRRSAAIASSEGNYVIARLYGDGTVTCSARGGTTLGVSCMYLNGMNCSLEQTVSS